VKEGEEYGEDRERDRRSKGKGVKGKKEMKGERPLCLAIRH